MPSLNVPSNGGGDSQVRLVFHCIGLLNRNTQLQGQVQLMQEEINQLKLDKTTMNTKIDSQAQALAKITKKLDDHLDRQAPRRDLLRLRNASQLLQGVRVRQKESISRLRCER